MEQENHINSSHSRANLPFMFGCLTLLILVSAGMYLLGKNSRQQSAISVVPTQVSQPDNSNLMTVNMTFFDEKLSPFWSFQTKYPKSYLVTSDEMMTFYKSQGGQAPPRLIFTVNNQPLNRNYYDVFKSGEKCIAIWTTHGFTSLDDWRNNVGIHEYSVLSTIKQKINNYNFQIEEVKTNDNKIHRLEAFIDFQEASYYFHTCDMSNKDDLMIILQNFDIRGKNSI